MQSSMGERLKKAAAVPSRGLDIARARRRGLIQRSVALVVMSLVVAGAVALGAVAYPALLGTDKEGRDTTPVGPCEPQPVRELTVWPIERASPSQMQEIRDYLSSREGVESFRYVSSEATISEAKKSQPDRREFWDGMSPDEVAASFRVVVEADATMRDVVRGLTRLDGVEEIMRGTPFDTAPGNCKPPGQPICAPAQIGRVQTKITPPTVDTVVHAGVRLEAWVTSHAPGCTPTLQVEFDGKGVAPPDGVGPDALELRVGSKATPSCNEGNHLAGDLLYTGRHRVTVGVGCDPSNPEPVKIVRTIAFDGDTHSETNARVGRD